MASERRAWIGRAALALCLLGAIVTVCHRELGFFVAPDPRVLLDVRDDIRVFEDLSKWPPSHGAFTNEGFVRCASGAWSASGWCLPGGAQGKLRYALPVPAGSRGLLVRLFFFAKDPQAQRRLLVFRDGETTPRLTFDHVYFADTRLDLSQVLSGPEPASRVVLSFEGRNPTAAPDVVVQYFEVRAFADPIPAAPVPWRMGAVFAALGLSLLPLISWRRLAPLWAVLTVGFILRYVALTRVLFLPLDFDTFGFYQLAKKMQLFTSTGFFSAQFGNREPLFLLMLKGACWLLGDSQTHVRLVSLFGSLAVILLTYRVGVKLFHPPSPEVGRVLLRSRADKATAKQNTASERLRPTGVQEGATGSRPSQPKRLLRRSRLPVGLHRPLGLLAAFAIAINLPLVRESVRGLRLEIELILLLLFIEAAFLAKFRSVWVRAGLCGLLGGALALLRTNYLVNLAVPLLAAFAPWKRRAGWAAALALVLMVGLYFPHRWNGHRLYGDWTWDNNARWWANIEFAGRPGWPSKVEMWRNTEGTGAKMTAFDYFFGLHTVPEFVVGNVRGLSKIIGHMEVIAFHPTVARATGINTRFLDWGFQFLGVVGLVMAAWIPGRRWLPLMFLCLLVHVAFVYDRGAVESWRHTYQAFPLFLFGVLVALSAFMGASRRLRRVS